MDNTVSLKNTNKITYKKGKQLSMKIGSTFFFHSVCGRKGNPFGGQRAIETEPFYCALIMITHHHIFKTRFIHTQIICCKFFVIIPSITQNGHLTSTTPSPQHLHVTMLSVLGSGKSTDSLPSKMEDRKCCHGHPNSRLFAQALYINHRPHPLPGLTNQNLLATGLQLKYPVSTCYLYCTPDEGTPKPKYIELLT